MKAREFLKTLVHYGRVDKDSLMLSLVMKELDELERLARIGKMFEWALSNDMVFNKFQSIQHLERIYEKHNENVKELIKTFKLTICESEEK